MECASHPSTNCVGEDPVFKQIIPTVRFAIVKTDVLYLTVRDATDEPPKFGRGTKRGGRPAELHLLKPVKPYSRRAEFIRYVAARDDCEIADVSTEFAMSRANINAFLTHIHKDHGIGYSKDETHMMLLFPKTNPTVDSVMKHGA